MRFYFFFYPRESKWDLFKGSKIFILVDDTQKHFLQNPLYLLTSKYKEFQYLEIIFMFIKYKEIILAIGAFINCDYWCAWKDI